MDIRVVYQPKEGEPLDLDVPLVDVPKDGLTIGEIVMRGNITMKEVRTCRHLRRSMANLISSLQYFKDPAATKKAFRGGYFNSGDLAVMYPDGYISILDRSKDIIISGGEVRLFSITADALFYDYHRTHRAWPSSKVSMLDTLEKR